MSPRIQVILSEEERELLRIQARRDGQSLSSWLRSTAMERLGVLREGKRLDSVEALRAFFEECDAREVGAEPDWEAHLDVIERSRSSGVSST